jgi:hypothetical protein
MRSTLKALMKRISRSGKRLFSMTCGFRIGLLVIADHLPWSAAICLVPYSSHKTQLVADQPDSAVRSAL